MKSDVVALFRELNRRPVQAGFASLEPALARVAGRLRSEGDQDGVRELAESLLGWAQHAQVNDASRARREAAKLLLEDRRHARYAAEVLGRVLTEVPDDPSLCELVVQQMLVLGSYAELERVLHSHAKAQDVVLGESAAEARAQAWTRLACLRAVRLRDVQGAIEAHELALAAQPDLATLHSLALLYESRGTDNDRVRAAQLYVTMADWVRPAQACEYLLRALDLQPHHPDALAALVAHEASSSSSHRVRMEEVRRRQRAAASYTERQPSLSLPPPLPNARSRAPGGSASVPSVAMSAGSVSPARRSATHAPGRSWSRMGRWSAGAAAAASAVALGLMFHDPPSEPSARAAVTQKRHVESAKRVAAPGPASAAEAASGRPDGNPLPALSPKVRGDEPVATGPRDALPQPPPPPHDAAAPPGQVHVGPKLTFVHGRRLSRQEFLEAVEELRSKASTCYGNGLARRSDLRGRVTLTWTITKAGRAARIGRRGDTLDDAALRGCIVEALSALEFPKPRSRRVRAQAALVFTPKPHGA